MKRTIAALAVALSAGLASAATAADLPRAYTKAPPVAVAVMSWNGFYAGIHGGGAWSDDVSMSYTDFANIGNTINAYLPQTITSSASSGLVGFHAGYNWQASPNWVLGIEGDWDWTNLNAGGTSQLTRPGVVGIPPLLLTDNVSLQTKVNWLASVRGRLGYASNNWLLYATGGVAFADMDHNARVNCTAVAPSHCAPTGQFIQAGFNETRVGGVIGGGVEFKAVTNWSLGLEYLYYRFNDTKSGPGSWTDTPTGAPAPFFACTVAGQNCARFDYNDVGLHTVRARLSYQFNSPIVAKY